MGLNRKVPFHLSLHRKTKIKFRLISQEGQNWLKLTAPKGDKQLIPRVKRSLTSQNHRMVKAERDILGSTSPNCLLKQGQLEQIALNLVRWRFEYFHRWRFHRVSG